VNLGEPSRRGDTVAFVVTGPAVAAVRVGVRTIRTFTSPQLPAGDRAAVFFVPAHSPQPVLNLPAGKPIQHLKIPGPHGAHTIAVEAVVPLDAAGRALPSRPSPTPIDATSFWQAPSAASSHHQTSRYHGRTRPRPGPCELSEHGLPGLTPEWGRTITRIVPVTNAAGQLFVSCINTEYYLNRTPLNVGLLLDARHPGQTLDALPGAQPIHANQNLVAYSAVNLAAKRIANAWLVVQGGSSQAQRLKVLHALRIVKLDVARPTSKAGH
jgi:hypothetical protein